MECTLSFACRPSFLLHLYGFILIILGEIVENGLETLSARFFSLGKPDSAPEGITSGQKEQVLALLKNPGSWFEALERVCRLFKSARHQWQFLKEISLEGGFSPQLNEGVVSILGESARLRINHLHASFEVFALAFYAHQSHEKSWDNHAQTTFFKQVTTLIYELNQIGFDYLVLTARDKLSKQSGVDQETLNRIDGLVGMLDLPAGDRLHTKHYEPLWKPSTKKESQEGFVMIGQIKRQLLRPLREAFIDKQWCECIRSLQLVALDCQVMPSILLEYLVSLRIYLQERPAVASDIHLLAWHVLIDSMASFRFTSGRIRPNYEGLLDQLGAIYNPGLDDIGAGDAKFVLV